MSLQVFCSSIQNDDGWAGGIQVYGAAGAMKFGRKHSLGMGLFAVADNTAEPTSLGTNGAGPCQIIVVHKAKGHGALGHYAGNLHAEQIIKGVRDMVERLGGGPIDTVVLAAGEHAINGKLQQEYKQGVLAGVRSVCQGAIVLWPDHPNSRNGSAYGVCYYLPLAEQVALFGSYWGGKYAGEGEPDHGITLHGY